MQYQNFYDEDSYHSEKDPPKNHNDDIEEDSRHYGSDIYHPSDRNYDRIFNNNDSGRLRDISHASKSKRILANSIKMGLNIPIVLHLLNSTDLTLSEDQIFNNILDEYEKHHRRTDTDTNFLRKSGLILKKMDSEFLQRSSVQVNQRSNIIAPSVRIQITQKKALKPLTCPVCFDEFSQESDVCRLLCNHFACRDCFGEYLRNKILIAQVRNFKCPMEECKFQIPENELKWYLKDQPELLVKYHKFKNAQEVAANPNLKWCIRPGCERVVEVRDPANPLMKCVCGQEFCFKCNNEWHPNMKCEDFIDKMYKNYIKTAEVRFCPNCRALIEKNDGCNHMTCIQCNYQFCWLCEQKYTQNHYGLFNLNGCPGLQFTNISKNSSPWRRRCHWLKSFLLSLLMIILALTIGPIIILFMAITFPLKRFFFDQRVDCSNCRLLTLNILKFFGLLALGIVCSPLILLVFMIIFLVRVFRRNPF